ncbi:hypothetical protein DL764_006152 [Monosporascus ibericus]|uniref:DFDF domain-containing protein n=1 Tax=Monosporascus ibericus TaxID=155417 RepID=A0A4V1XA67_9PEZI|nr:hypothetical protein DL764_006152 [Monosporascus ibericus]
MPPSSSRISLISKSDIRYSGVLHEINSEESTVSLENVTSFGTEGRRGNPDEEIPPADQVYEYIVFRGSDVKDLRIETPAPPKENKPPKMPDDPAILGARPRPAGSAPGPGLAGQGPSNNQQGPGPVGFGPSQYQPNPFYPPGPGQWGRGGPGPGPVGFNGMPYPPPHPSWLPPGQGFPPGAPGPWNSFGYPPPGPHGPAGAPGQARGVAPQPDIKPAPIGAGAGVGADPGAGPTADKPKPVGTPQAAESKSLSQPPVQAAASAGPAPTPPVESKPSVAQVKASADALSTKSPAPASSANGKPAPTGPKNPRGVTPAVPIPTAILSRSGPQATAVAATVKTDAEPSNASNAVSLKDATQAAKEAVAVAMAKLNNQAKSTDPNTTDSTTVNAGQIDNLTKRVNEMRVNAATGGRGRGRGGRSRGPNKVEVPDADFDFETANAKFSKQDLVKEAVATGSPLGESANGASSEVNEPEDSSAAPAYNKTKSFFDNISSEAKDRAENGGQKPASTADTEVDIAAEAADVDEAVVEDMAPEIGVVVFAKRHLSSPEKQN